MCVQNAMDLPAVGAYESLMNQNVMVAQLAQMQQDQQQVMMRQAAQNRVVAAQSVAAHQKAAQVSHSSFPRVFIAIISCTHDQGLCGSASVSTSLLQLVFRLHSHL